VGTQYDLEVFEGSVVGLEQDVVATDIEVVFLNHLQQVYDTHCGVLAKLLL